MTKDVFGRCVDSLLTNSLWTAFELSSDRFHHTKAGKAKEAGKGGKVAETVFLSRNHMRLALTAVRAGTIAAPASRAHTSGWSHTAPGPPGSAAAARTRGTAPGRPRQRRSAPGSPGVQACAGKQTAATVLRSIEMRTTGQETNRVYRPTGFR